jgi:glycosyltransferase involved in cell wall biosynthesis
VHAFAPGGARSYLRAGRELRRRFAGERFDVVHAHFGLTAWPALAVDAGKRVLTLHGNDLHDARSRRATLLAARRYDLVATVSSELAALVDGAGTQRQIAVLPCGVDLDRFRPMDRADCRRQLGLDPDGRYLLFCHNPQRPDKRYDRALELAGDVSLLTLGTVPPDEVPLWHNAANAVLVPSDYEGFGLAVLEALACDVPVLATRTGVHPVALDGLDGGLCADYDHDVWAAALAQHLAASDPRIAGRDRAMLMSADTMAARVVAAWSSLLGAPLYSAAPAPQGGAVSA